MKELTDLERELLNELIHSTSLMECVCSEAMKPAIKRNKELIKKATT